MIIMNTCTNFLISNNSAFSPDILLIRVSYGCHILHIFVRLGEDMRDS